DPAVPPTLPGTSKAGEPPEVPGNAMAPGAWAPGTPVGKGDRYLIRRKLGEGARSEVYLCAALGMAGVEKNVVIQSPRGEVARDARLAGAFIREASLGAALSHRNVVRIHDFDQHDGTPFCVMEYVRGRSLGDVLRRSQQRRRPLSPGLIAWIGEEVAQGLSAAHQGLLHLNLWPGNVLLSFDGAVKVTDAGTASRGKPGYSSPEQVRGEEVDARGDVFSLGVVLWESLTGRRLFDADSEEEIRAAVESQDIFPPSLLNFFDVPEALSQVVMRALERDPDRRFQSADELGRALGSARAAAGAPEERELAHHLRELYGLEIARQKELDQAPVLVPLSPEPAEPEPVEISPVSGSAVWIPMEAETVTVITSSDLTASMRVAGDDDGDLKT
ncbi:MAG TPA: serine/threonine-protein kinase, partial [Myxococcales bacterium]|nr:serine/threonine-protein kinase [Myxococcales bacterium]